MVCQTIRLWCAGVFNWMRQNACMSLSGSTDGCQREWMGATDCIFALGKMKEVAPANSSAERHHYLFKSAESANCVDKLQRCWRLLADLCLNFQVVHLLLAHHLLTHTHFPPNLHLHCSHAPLLAVSLCSLWVMGTDGWQVLAVSLGSSTPLFLRRPWTPATDGSVAETPME